MSDGGTLLRASAAGETIRAMAAVTTGVVEEARQRHGTYPTATAALGRTLTAGLLLGATTKNGKLDVAGAIGDGLLCVMRTQPWNKEPYRSVMKLVSGEIAEDITHYLTMSEQLPSATGLGVFVNSDGTVEAAGGFLVQVLNGAPPDLVALIERNVAALPHVTALIRRGDGPREILQAVLAGLEVRPIDDAPVQFACSCTRARVLGALLLLGTTEIEDMIEKDGKAEVRCEFCAEEYVVDEAELAMLIRETQGSA